MTGKYDKIMDMGITYETTSNAFREAIANELAEANRLKLIELGMKIDMYVTGKPTGKILESLKKLLEDELEDRA